jgi:hypothetical protein
MFDHVSVRVMDLPLVAGALGAGLKELGIEQTRDSPRSAGWGDFALAQDDDDHPITRRIHIAFIAKAQADVDRFWQAGVAGGLADDGRAGPRPDYADDYYAGFLKDAAGNSFEAVHRDGERPRGNIDHVVMRVADLEASTAFYTTAGAAAGLTVRSQRADRTAFSALDQAACSSWSRATRPSTSTLPSPALTMPSAAFTPTRSLPDTAATASPVSDRTTTRGTTPRSYSIPTATTSRSSTTTANDRPV